MIHLIPGDPISVMMGRSADPEALAAVRARYGLDRPLPVQYFSWLGDALQGDLGRSIRTDSSVWNDVVDRLPPTLYLMMGGMLVAVALAGPIGILAAARRNTWVDLVGSSATFALTLRSALAWSVANPGSRIPVFGTDRLRAAEPVPSPE